MIDATVVYRQSSLTCLLTRVLSAASVATAGVGCHYAVAGTVGASASRLFDLEATHVPNPIADTVTIRKTDSAEGGPTRNAYVNGELKCASPVFGLVRGVLTGVYSRDSEPEPVTIDLDSVDVRLMPLVNGRFYLSSPLAQDTGPLGQFLFDFRSLGWWRDITEVAIAIRDPRHRLLRDPYPLFGEAPRDFVEAKCIIGRLPMHNNAGKK